MTMKHDTKIKDKNDRAATALETEAAGAEAVTRAEGEGMPPPDPGDPAADLQSRVSDLEDKLYRARAEVQNVQKRTANEKIEAVRYANADLMRSLLQVLDDFERSIEAAKTATDAAAIREGEQMIYENFVKALRDHGLEEVEAKGKPFNPQEHEALMQQTGDGKPAGTILEVAARGWRLGDRVIRPAKVIIAK